MNDHCVSQWFSFSPMSRFWSGDIEAYNHITLSSSVIIELWGRLKGFLELFWNVLDLSTFLTTGFLKLTTSEALFTFTYTLLPLLFLHITETLQLLLTATRFLFSASFLTNASNGGSLSFIQMFLLLISFFIDLSILRFLYISALSLRWTNLTMIAGIKLSCRGTGPASIWYAFNLDSEIVISVFLYILVRKTRSWGRQVSSCRASQGGLSIIIESLLVYLSCSLNLLSRPDTKSHISANLWVHWSWCSFSYCTTPSRAVCVASSVIPAKRASIDSMGNYEIAKKPRLNEQTCL